MKKVFIRILEQEGDYYLGSYNAQAKQLPK